MDRARRTRAYRRAHRRRRAGPRGAARALPLFAELFAGRSLGAARRGGRRRTSCADGALHPSGGTGMTTAEWLDIGWVDPIPVRGSRTVQVEGGDEIGRAHVCTPVTNAHLACRH